MKPIRRVLRILRAERHLTKVQDDSTAFARGLEQLINKSNGQYVGHLFRRDIAEQVETPASPKAICMVAGIIINGEDALGRARPWVLVTDRQLVIVQVGALEDLPTLRLTRPHCRCFDVHQVVSISAFNGKVFEVSLKDGTEITIRSRPWLDKKYTVAVRAALVDVSQGEAQ